jgi:hypothetical protein
MTKDLQVPAQVQALGRLLKASLNCPQVISTISYKTRFSGATFLSQAHDYLDLLQHHLGNLTPSLEALMVDIIENPAVSEATLTRRTQAFLDDLADWRQAALEIQNLNARGADDEGASLLLSVYRHYLDLVDEWLRRLVDSIENPGKVLQGRGVIWDDETDRTLELDVRLRLTQPPDFPKLSRWVERRVGQESLASHNKLKLHASILGLLAGLFWLH